MNVKTIKDFGENTFGLSVSSPTFGFYPPYESTVVNNGYFDIGLHPFPYMGGPGTEGDWVFNNPMKGLCEIQAQHNCTINPNDFLTKLNQLQIFGGDYQNDYFSFDSEIQPATNDGWNWTPDGTAMIWGYSFSIVHQNTTNQTDANNFQSMIDNYHMHGSNLTGEYSGINISDIIDKTNEVMLVGYGSKTPDKWDNEEYIHDECVLRNEVEFPTSITRFYDRIAEWFNSTVDSYESNKEIYIEYGTSEGEFVDYQNYGNLPLTQTVDSSGQVAVQMRQRGPGGVRFYCSQGCEHPYTNDLGFHLDIDAADHNESLLGKAIRCACDGKVFAVSQYGEMKYVAGYGQGGGNMYGYYPWQQTRYYIIRPTSGLDNFNTTDFQYGYEQDGNFYLTQTYPYENLIQYETGIQHNGDIINFDDGETYDVNQSFDFIGSDTDPADEDTEEDDDGDGMDEDTGEEDTGEDIDQSTEELISEIDFYGFGHKDFEIEQTLSASLDPYRGIDFRDGDLNLCSHIEFMFSSYKPHADNWGDNIGTGWLEDSLELNWGDNVYYNVTENLQNYLDILPNGTNENLSFDAPFDCDYVFGDNTQLHPLKEIKVVCKNGKKLSMCDSGGDTCNFFDYSYYGYSGNQVCEYYAQKENYELYFSGNKDGRMGLGLYYYDEYDHLDHNLQINSQIDDTSFEQYNPEELILNGNGSDVENDQYYTSFLGSNSYKPNGWGYVVLDGVKSAVGSDYTLNNLTNLEWQNQYKQFNPDGRLYSGYHPYILPIVEQQSNVFDQSNYIPPNPTSAWNYSGGTDVAQGMEWARWVESSECYSHDKCLRFSASSAWANTEGMIPDESGLDQNGDIQDWSTYEFALHNHNQYRTINQAYLISPDLVANFDLDTELEVSFYMKTLKSKAGGYGDNYMPQVEAAIYTNRATSLAKEYAANDPHVHSPAVDKPWMVVGDSGNLGQPNFYSPNALRTDGRFNSTHHQIDSATITNESDFSLLGSTAVFQNTGYKNWEKFSYTFKLSDLYTNPFESKYINSQMIKNLTFIIQAYGEYEGDVLLDNFSVKESFDFTPDVHVTNKIDFGEYSPEALTKYYDTNLLNNVQNKRVEASIKVGFYFYPRHNSNYIFDIDKPINKKDLKNKKLYLYDVDWGDGENDYNDEPFQLFNNSMVYHYYKKSGTYKITGYILKMKTRYINDEKDINVYGVAKNKRFELYININYGIDEDFNYFYEDGFSFIPYKYTTPVIGGISKKSSYYNTIKRQLGFLTDNVKLNIDFDNKSDKLKTELALLKMDASFVDELDVLSSYTSLRYNNIRPDGTVDDNTEIINEGIKPLYGELGTSIGDVDITNIKYYNEPKSIWEMFGFEENDLNIIGNPDESRYWKNIIPEDYSIYNREGVSEESIDTYSEQEWLDDYYYPVLPKYGANGKFIDGDFPNNKIQFPIEAPITDENENSNNLLTNIVSSQLDKNICTDNSGNFNLGFIFTDYKPMFNTETLQPKEIKSLPKVKTMKKDGAF